MKLIKITVRLLALYVSICLTMRHFTTKVAHGYHISQIQADRVTLCDSAAHGIDLYKLSFETVPTDYEHGLFVGGIEPYLRGCADSLTGITFTTTPQDLARARSPTNKGKQGVEALTLQECAGNDTVTGNFYSNTEDLKTFLRKDRHWQENTGHEGRILWGRPLYIAMPKHGGTLHRIILRFENKQIVCKVRQSISKTYFIKSIVTNTPERLPKVINLNANIQEMSSHQEVAFTGKTF